MEKNEILQVVADACEDRKAEEITILDMKQLTPMADYFLICHGTNERQVQAIAKSIKDSLEELNYEVKRMEGFEQARWVLIDIGDIVCHIFHKDERSYYNLERLWGDATLVPLKEIG